MAARRKKARKVARKPQGVIRTGRTTKRKVERNYYTGGRQL